MEFKVIVKWLESYIEYEVYRKPVRQQYFKPLEYIFKNQ